MRDDVGMKIMHLATHEEIIDYVFANSVRLTGVKVHEMLRDSI